MPAHVLARRPWFPCLVAALIGMAIYAVTIGGTYIYDDVAIVRDDRRMHDADLWPLLWSRDYAYNVDEHDGSVDNLYRPLASQSFAVEVWLYGDRPGPMHATNVVLYGGCCALVSLLGRRLGGPKLSWIAGCLFAAHPVHADVVCSLVGRAEIMALLGILGALLIHLSGPPSLERTLGILLCTAFSILSKEQGMLIPFLLLVAEPVRRRIVPPPENAKLAREDMRILIGTLALTVGLYVIVREQFLGLHFAWERSNLDPAVQPMIWSRGADRALMPLVLLGRYASQLTFPTHLSFDYSGRAIGWVVSPADPYLYAGAFAALLGIAGLAIAVSRKAWTALFLLAGLALTYGIVGNVLFLIGTNYGERLMFTPSTFFVLLVGMAIARTPVRGAMVVTAALCVAGAAFSANYARRWNDRTAFYRWSLRNEPKAMRVHQTLLAELIKEGKLDEAAEVAASGRAVMPEYWDVFLNSALVAEKRGRWDEAEGYYATAMKLKPGIASNALAGFKQRRHEATSRAASSPAP